MKKGYYCPKKGKYENKVDEIKADYDDLKELMEQTSEQQVKRLASQMDQLRGESYKAGAGSQRGHSPCL